METKLKEKKKQLQDMINAINQRTNEIKQLETNAFMLQGQIQFIEEELKESKKEEIKNAK